MATRQSERKALGARAESLACEHLIGRGFTILGRNVRVGAREIDIIARRGDLLVFCEVRARARTSAISPLETIDRAKAQRIRDAARRWLYDHRVRRIAVRFDAAAVVFDEPEGTLDYVEDAF